MPVSMQFRSMPRYARVICFFLPRFRKATPRELPEITHNPKATILLHIIVFGLSCPWPPSSFGKHTSHPIENLFTRIFVILQTCIFELVRSRIQKDLQITRQTPNQYCKSKCKTTKLHYFFHHRRLGKQSTTVCKQTCHLCDETKEECLHIQTFLALQFCFVIRPSYHQNRLGQHRTFALAAIQHVKKRLLFV